jgi:hypothetical protein
VMMCSSEGCLMPIAVVVNDRAFCQHHMSEEFGRLGQSIKAGLEDMEQAMRSKQ